MGQADDEEARDNEPYPALRIGGSKTGNVHQSTAVAIQRITCLRSACGIRQKHKATLDGALLDDHRGPYNRRFVPSETPVSEAITFSWEVVQR